MSLIVGVCPTKLVFAKRASTQTTTCRLRRCASSVVLVCSWVPPSWRMFCRRDLPSCSNKSPKQMDDSSSSSPGETWDPWVPGSLDHEDARRWPIPLGPYFLRAMFCPSVKKLPQIKKTKNLKRAFPPIATAADQP